MPFFSQIAGLPVVDAQGHAQGKIADVVVAADAQYPVVTALAVRDGRREQPTLVPWNQVLNFDTTVVLRQPKAHIVPYQPGSRELLVGQQILDRQIVDVEGRKVVRVNDLQIARTNGHYSLIG